MCWLHAPDLQEQNKKRVAKQATLPWELYASLTDELTSLRTTELYFAGGGEPLVHPQAWEALERSVQKGFTTSLHTNFSLVSDEDIPRILELGIHHLTVSLWAGSPETYRATHPGSSEGDFEQITGRLRSLNERKAGSIPVPLRSHAAYAMKAAQSWQRECTWSWRGALREAMQVFVQSDSVSIQ